MYSKYFFIHVDALKPYEKIKIYVQYSFFKKAEIKKGMFLFTFKGLVLKEIDFM